jgi:N-acetylmuramoyl-L-alanine amidase
MADPKRYQFNLPKSRRPNESSIAEPWYPGVQKYWPTCTSKRSVDPIMGIVAVVIHATAGASSEGAISVMKKPVDAASFHWLVPDEDELQHGQFVWACVPEALAAWPRSQCASHPTSMAAPGGSIIGRSALKSSILQKATHFHPGR